MHIYRQSHILRGRHRDTEERVIFEESTERREAFWLRVDGNVGAMQRHLRVAIDNRPHLTPFGFQMLISKARRETAAEAVKSLVAGKGFVTGVVNEH